MSMLPGTAMLTWNSLMSNTLRGDIHWVNASSESFSLREVKHADQGCREVTELIMLKISVLTFGDLYDWSGGKYNQHPLHECGWKQVNFLCFSALHRGLEVQSNGAARLFNKLLTGV